MHSREAPSQQRAKWVGSLSEEGKGQEAGRGGEEGRGGLQTGKAKELWGLD